MDAYREAEVLRFNLARYERVHRWLPMLLDCYALVDYSVNRAVSLSDRKLSCRKGCSSCCAHAIPLSTLEAVGVSFYIHELLPPDIRAGLVRRLRTGVDTCLFNIDDVCVIYPMRPIACRRYLVTSRCCAPGENAALSRPEDILEPSREYLYAAVEMTLPFYPDGKHLPPDGKKAFEFYKKQNVLLSSVYATILGL